MSGAALMAGQLAAFADAFSLGVVTLDADQRVVIWNRWMEECAGLKRDDVLGRPLAELFPDIAGTRLAEAIDFAIRRRMPAILSPALNRSLLRLYKDDDDRRHDRRMRHLIHIVHLRDPAQAGACLLQISDVTAAVNRERLLRQQAENLRVATQMDALTGVFNRRHFDVLLGQEFRKAQASGAPLGVVQLDIDEYGRFSTFYGQAAAERCLLDVANALKDSVPDGGIVGRYGDDQFAIVLSGLDEDAVSEFAENLRLRIVAMAIPHEGAKSGRFLSVSVGAAVMESPGQEIDVNALVSSSDIALFQARNEGRNAAILFSMAEGNFRNCA